MAQVNIKPALEHFSISATSYVAATQDVHRIIDGDQDMELENPALASKFSALKPIERAIALVKELFGVETLFSNMDEAVITTQALVEMAVRNECMIEDPDMAVMAAQKRTKDFMAKPGNKFLLLTNYQAGPAGAPTLTEKREILEGVETVVAVTSEGKFKKGEKERLAMELYQDYLKTAADPNDNKAFIAILMDKLGMTKAGATTYNYNMKKKYNPTNVTAKPKRV